MSNDEQQVPILLLNVAPETQEPQVRALRYLARTRVLVVGNLGPASRYRLVMMPLLVGASLYLRGLHPK